MHMDFGGCFAYKDGAAHPGKLREGEHNMAKKALKKSKKIQPTKPLMAHFKK
jgi:hypothetical protein